MNDISTKGCNRSGMMVALEFIEVGYWHFRVQKAAPFFFHEVETILVYTFRLYLVIIGMHGYLQWLSVT